MQFGFFFGLLSFRHFSRSLLAMTTSAALIFEGLSTSSLMIFATRFILLCTTLSDTLSNLTSLHLKISINIRTSLVTFAPPAELTDTDDNAELGVRVFFGDGVIRTFTLGVPAPPHNPEDAAPDIYLLWRRGRRFTFSLGAELTAHTCCESSSLCPDSYELWRRQG